MSAGFSSPFEIILDEPVQVRLQLDFLLDSILLDFPEPHLLGVTHEARYFVAKHLTALAQVVS